jgi:hypothetical protein
VRAALRLSLLVVLLLAAVTGRAILGGEREIRMSTAALDAGDLDGAIAHARAAALWYVPGAPHVDVAYGRLWAIGEEAERRRQWEVSLAAYRSIASASASTRWVKRPRANLASLADTRAAGVVAKQAGATREVPAQPGEGQPAPRWLARAAMPVAFLGWLGGIVWTLRRGLDEAGHLAWRRSLPGLALAALGFAAYGVAAWFA